MPRDVLNASAVASAIRNRTNRETHRDVDQLITRPLQILGAEPRALRDPREHPGTDFDAVIEGPDEIGKAVTLKYLVRPVGLALDTPADPLERRENAGGSRRAPAARKAPVACPP